jgi:hypothetical protein
MRLDVDGAAFETEARFEISIPPSVASTTAVPVIWIALEMDTSL